MARTKKKEAEIWAVGGGKGGIGKSFIVSTLGSHLAQKGQKVILVDADLGAANLHTFLGVGKPQVSLTDFFERKTPLADLVVPTGIANMGLLVGAVHSLAADSIKYAQKTKLLRHIKNLDTDYVLIDLGAGAHFNTIDTFLLADKMIVVIVPEITAIENMYYFVKNVFFRQLMKTLTANGHKEIFHDAWVNRTAYNIANLRQLIDHLNRSSDEVRAIIARELGHFNVQIILNQVRSNQEIAIGSSVKSVCLKYFGLSAGYAGFLEHDDFISRCINKRQPYLQAYPESRCAKELEALAQNLIEGKQVEI
jgi:flagellar biosynthesis protein FlhG